MEEPPEEEEEESRAKRSGFPYAGFEFCLGGGGVEVEVDVDVDVVLGLRREVEASVGGLEGVVDAQRSANESLIVGW